MRKLLVKYAWFISALAILIGYALLFRTAEVSGTSMVPTYQPRDLLLLWRTEYAESGKILAIYNEQLNEVLCKRVIGVSGDHVVIDDTGLSINDVSVVEDYVSTDNWYTSSIKVDLVVPDGEIFVMGDNRIASNDSRALGCMPTSDIVGVSIWNVTKSVGIRRDTLVRVVTLLFVLSVGWDIVAKLRRKGNETFK